MLHRRTHLVPLAAVLDDLVGDGTGLGKGRDVLADGVEGDSDVLGHGSRELGLGLVTDNGERSGVLDLLLLDESGDTGVDTTAETSVRGDGEVEDLGGLGGGLLLGLDVLEELCDE